MHVSQRTFAAFTLIILLLAVLFAPVRAQKLTTPVTADDIRTHLRYLASDELEGRGTGAEGNRKAAAYIAENLSRFGLKPGGDNGTYFQSFDFISNVKLGSKNALRLTGGGLPPTPGILEGDFNPMGFSASAHATGQLVFAGYGIVAPDKKYDDYEGLDVKGKVVVVFRYGPDGNSPRSDFSRFTSFRNKERIAREKGAAAVLVITGSAGDEPDDLVRFRADPSGEFSGIPILSVRRAMLLPYFKAAGRDMKNVQDSIKAELKPRSFVFVGASADLTTDVEKVQGKTANVIGILEGANPKLKDQVLVLGAHFDHLGYGGPNSMMPDTVAIHNGADDNASGTSGLLELAQLFGAAPPPGRTMVFTFFSGEELGTLGSLHYVAAPTLPLTQTVAMLNMDMIGRMVNRTLDIGGTGTSPIWNDLLNGFNRDSSFTFKFNPDGFGPSDHASFYGKDIPVLFFFTGIHDDYHRPSDDWDKINYPDEARVVKLVASVAQVVDTLQMRPTYARVESSSSAPAGDSRGFSVTLGIVPDFTESTSNGLKISGIRPHGPAEKAGLKSGDIIVKMAGKAILGIYDYMGVLGELKAGQEVQVEYMREGKTFSTMATMTKRN
jgi:aminopeptidase YwaD